MRDENGAAPEGAVVGKGPAPGGLMVLPDRLGDWLCDDVRVEGDESLRARFRWATGNDWIEVIVTAGAASPDARVFHRFARCTVRYRGQLSETSASRKDAVRTIVMGVGAAIDARLVDEPEGTTLAAALGRRRAAGPVVFSRATLSALLAPEIVVGRALAGGWTLTDIYPSSYVRNAPGQTLELVCDFERVGAQRRALFVVAPRDDNKPGFLRTTHFSLTHLSLGAADAPGIESLRALLGFVLQLRDDPAMEVHFPDVQSDVDFAPALGAGAPDETALAVDAESHRALNLAIQAECGQSCSFCSVKETSPAEDGGERVLARLVGDLAASRRRGVRALRLNGYDPLAYSRVIEVLERAKSLGYDHVDVFSPCTLLASRVFFDSVVDVLPQSHVFNVPLYALDAAVHDRVVGRGGAHALVLEAIEHILSRSGPDAVHVLSVVTSENAALMPALSAWARSRSFRFSAHMPYPSFESRADKFFRAAPTQTAVVAAFVPDYQAVATARPLPVVGLAPCVTLRVLGAAGVPVRRWLSASSRRALPGTEYASDTFRHGAGERANAAFVASTVPCPHIDRCAVRDACSGELIRSYVELHGSGEFQPVSLDELVAAT